MRQQKSNSIGRHLLYIVTRIRYHLRMSGRINYLIYSSCSYVRYFGYRLRTWIRKSYEPGELRFVLISYGIIVVDAGHWRSRVLVDGR